MQTKSRPLDDLTNLFTNAVGAAKGVGDEVKAMGRAQAEKMISDLDLIGRDEFEVYKSMLLQSKVDIETLQKKVKSLEAEIRKLKKAK